MQIFVQVNQRALSLDLDEATLLSDVKQRVCDTATTRYGQKCTPDETELLASGNALEGEKTLKENGISPGDMLELYSPMEA
jgi:hypothetical protein